MSIRIAVISDIHYSGCHDPRHPKRRGDYALFFLKRAVEMLNLYDRPDVVLVGGDLIDPPLAADIGARNRLKEIFGVLKTLKAPFLAVPGNHDLAPDPFYDTLPELPDFLEVKNVRIIPFLDPTEPGYNARRSRQELDRFDRVRAGFSGQLVSFQHVALFPPGRSKSPYNYTNAREIINRMHQVGCTLSIGGHYHEGCEPVNDGKATFCTVPALCESPFSYAIVDLGDDGTVQYRVDELRLPSGFNWFDCHTHTPYAYCGENMDITIEEPLSRLLNLTGTVLTEHSGHLYFSPRDYWETRRWYIEGMESARRIDRYPEYEQYFHTLSNPCFHLGLEIDVDRRGNLIVPDHLLKTNNFRLGAVHHLEPASEAKMMEEFLFLTDKVTTSPTIKVLAHPMRTALKNRLPIEPLIEPVIRILKKNNVAAEVNFHQNLVEPEFVRAALEAEVKFSFGSDAHNLADYGFLQPHIRMLRELGYNGDFWDILVTPLTTKVIL